ncbi:hypothetical protein BSPWISOXPB_1579 [uncultured Gammaproteobacteria bacterium]|nr:hypothetical protein BSPWISOXPB_1579 [uncultured Gammaproteobacteria bacterium]
MNSKNAPTFAMDTVQVFITPGESIQLTQKLSQREHWQRSTSSEQIKWIMLDTND